MPEVKPSNAALDSCQNLLKSYPTAHAMFPGSLPGVSCFKKARKPKKKWKPFKPPFPPGDRPLSYEEQLENLVRNPIIPKWMKEHFQMAGKLLNGRLAVSQSVLDTEEGLLSLVTYADELEAIERTGRKGIRTVGRLISYKDNDQFTTEVLLSDESNHKIVVPLDRHVWTQFWLPVVKIGKTIEIFCDLYTTTDCTQLMVPRGVSKPNVMINCD